MIKNKLYNWGKGSRIILKDNTKLSGRNVINNQIILVENNCFYDQRRKRID